MEPTLLDTLNKWFFPSLVAIMGTYLFWEKKNNRNDRKEDESSPLGDKNGNQIPDNITNNYEGLSMHQLLERVMKNIGCRINMCKDEEDHFYVTYQGEHFTIAYSEENPYITIYDVAWYSAELNDIDNLSMVRKAVNECNKQNLSTILYTIDKEENCVNVHTRQNIIFGLFIPDIEDYLRSRFEDSFRQHHNFYRQIEEVRKGMVWSEKNK